MARAMKDSGVLWIGEIPADWKKYKLKHIGTYLNGYAFKPEQWGGKGRRIIRIQDLTGTSDNPNYYNGDIDEKYIIKNGDILVSWAATLSAFIWNKGEGVLNQHIFKATNHSDIVDRDYFFWLIRIAMENMNNDNKHGIMMQHVTLDVFGNFEIALPCIREQIQIALLLEKECARIDAVMEQTRASIEEYKKLKQSIITEAVTKGIRPNRPMKDSGIDWIGLIPADWNVQRIKTIFRLRDERNYLPLEEINLISLYTDKGVVQHADLEQTTGNKATNADGYKKVYPNDIVVNIILCWMGAIGRSEYEGVTSPAYDIYIPSVQIDSRFYHHYFRTTGFSGDCYKRGKGIMAMRWRTYSDQFRDIPVVVPPVEEQREILRYLDKASAEIAALIAKKERFLSEMESYKKSLIFEYVTGKKEA